LVGTDSHTKPGLEVSLPIHGAGLAAGENNPAFFAAAVDGAFHSTAQTDKLKKTL